VRRALQRLRGLDTPDVLPADAGRVVITQVDNSWTNTDRLRGSRIAAWPRRWLEHQYLPWALALLAMVLCLPALRLGRLLDDDFHCLALMRPDLPIVSRSPAELFVFIKGDVAANRWSRTMGLLPWWADERLRIAFLRPLTGLTHWLDYTLWPQTVWAMHLHSLLWFGGVVAAAALFYRRMLGAAWVAGLAAVLFAVDDAHGMPAVWIANRNALLGALFGLLTLIAHDRWRRDGWWPGAVLAPLALLLGLLAKESTVAISAYLLAYALFLDRGARVARLASLAPATLICIGWSMVYKHLGYGAVGSGWYVDPSADPARFAQAVAERAPNLLAWQWLVPSSLRWTLSPEVVYALWLAAMGVLMVIAAALVPLLRRDRLARFWALGMLLSVLPACTVYPSDRLLFFVGIGGMGLLAQLLARFLKTAGCPSAHGWQRIPAGVLCCFLVFVHLAMAPWHLAKTTSYLRDFERSVAQTAASLPSDPATRFQTVLLVNSPTFASFAYGALTRFVHDDPYLNPTLVLGSGSRPIEVQRPDERTLLIRPDGGFLARAGNPQYGGEMAPLLFDQRRAFLTLDWLYRNRAPMKPGWQVQSVGVTIEVTAVTDDGRPGEVAFRFVIDLNNPYFCWKQWQNGAFAPFEVPAVGQTIRLPAATLPPNMNKG
jgi:hypothetical protein